MAQRIKTTAERGRFKEIIHSALFKNKDIRDLLLGDTSELSKAELMSKFKDHVKSHLFVDDVIQETDAFIFYDVSLPILHTNIKTCKILMYLICHRDILENYNAEGYYGNRADILSQMVEDVMINDDEVARDFGIGKLMLESVEIYNSTKFYGCVMTFDVPNFR